jgi:hypothetical protein
LNFFFIHTHICVSKRNEKENQLKKKSQWGHWKKVEWFPSFGYALRKKKIFKYKNTRRIESNIFIWCNNVKNFSANLDSNFWAPRFICLKFMKLKKKRFLLFNLFPIYDLESRNFFYLFDLIFNKSRFIIFW